MARPNEVSLLSEWIPELDRWVSVWGDEPTYKGDYWVTHARMYIPSDSPGYSNYRQRHPKGVA